MAITIAQVEQVARLAKLQFDSEEKKRMAEQLNLIVDYVEKLNELDTSEVAPTAHILNLTNVLREDSVEPSLSPEEVLQNAPRQNNSHFSVPRVIKEL